MSTAGRPTEAAASDLKAGLDEAGFVRLVAAADADSIAAAALVASTLDSGSVPYQTSVAPLAQPAARSTDADLTITIGRRATGGDLTIGLDESAARTAYAVASEVGAADLPLALAGAVARDGHPGTALATAAHERGIEREPGVAVPTAELAEGLAHSTLVHAPFSGAPTAAEALLRSLDIPDQPGADDCRRLASAVALTVASDSAGTSYGSEAIERFLRPLSGGPFETIGGYADILGAVACEQPGLAIVLALGKLDEDQALEYWRQHASQAHEAISEARTSRYDGLYILQCDGQHPVGTVARLVAQYRSPEPVVLVVGSSRAAVWARDDAAMNAGAVLDDATTAVGGTAGSTSRRGRAQFEADPTEFVAAITEAL